MKKFFTVAASLILSAAMLTACGSSAAPAATTGAPETTAVTQAPATETTEETKSFHIAIVQQLDHASLDEIRLAVEDELTKAAADKGFQVSYKEFNGQNDNTVLNQIGAQVVSDKYDAIIPIASLAAQCMVTAADGTNTPIIYAAVSDPATAGLTDIPNVTGTSDALNTAFILDMMLAAQPDVKTVGLLYSNSEANSQTPIAQAKEYLEQKGIAYIEKTGNSTDEILTAAERSWFIDSIFCEKSMQALQLFNRIRVKAAYLLICGVGVFNFLNLFLRAYHGFAVYDGSYLVHRKRVCLYCERGVYRLDPVVPPEMRLALKFFIIADSTELIRNLGYERNYFICYGKRRRIHFHSKPPN